MKTSFDFYTQTYEERIDESLAVFGQKHAFFVRDKVFWLLQAFRKAGSLNNLKVLDVGCGIGLGHDVISSSIGELHGVEISEDSLDVARRDYPDVRYRAYNGKRLPYADDSFNCVYAVCVLHHVPESQWLAFMAEMARVTKTDGILMVIEHNPLNPATQWIVRTCEIDRDAVLVKPWQMYRLFRRVGVTSARVRYTLFTPFEQPFFRAVDRAFARIPFGAQYVAIGRVG